MWVVHLGIDLDELLFWLNSDTTLYHCRWNKLSYVKDVDYILLTLVRMYEKCLRSDTSWSLYHYWPSLTYLQ